MSKKKRNSKRKIQSNRKIQINSNRNRKIKRKVFICKYLVPILSPRTNENKYVDISLIGLSR